MTEVERSGGRIVRERVSHGERRKQPRPRLAVIAVMREVKCVSVCSGVRVGVREHDRLAMGELKYHC